MRAGLPWWGLLSATAAPVLLIGGWTAAAARQPHGFNQVAGTISALAARDATDRWLMTSALAGVGVCHVVTALALRPAARPGRLVLALGGVATMAVAAAPLPAGDGSSGAHTAAAAVSFVSLGVWPALAGRESAPGTLRRRVALGGAIALSALVGWFFVELVADTGRVGLAERVAAGAQALWPWATVLSVRLAAG
jgi:hypothetical membrane protein